MDVTEDDCVLIYDYLNEPNADAVDSMHMHRGTARLVLVDTDPVSYTHLDVYKRQSSGCARARHKREACNFNIAGWSGMADKRYSMK